MRIVIEHTDELFADVARMIGARHIQLFEPAPAPHAPDDDMSYNPVPPLPVTQPTPVAAPTVPPHFNRVQTVAVSNEEILQEMRRARGLGETPTVPDGSGSNPLPPPSNAPVESINLDSEGLPWDSRIHSSSKAKNADGTWRIKRNSDKEFVAGVVAELKKVMAIPAPTAVTSPSAVEPPPTVATVPPPPVAAPAADTLAGLMDYIMERNRLGTLPMATVTHTVKAQGLGSLRDLDTRPDLIPAFKAALEAV